MYCTKCGAEAKEGAKFCTRCGARLEAPGQDGRRDVGGAGADDPAATQAPSTTASYPALDSALASHLDGTGELPPSIPQDDILFRKKPSRAGRAAVAAVVACAAVALVAGGAWWMISRGGGGEAEETVQVDAPKEDAVEEPAARPLDLSIENVTTSSYPQVSVDLSVGGDDLSGVSSLTAADFAIAESDGSGPIGDVTPTRVTPSDDGASVRIVYTSPADGTAERTTTISLDEMSGFSGSVSFVITGAQQEAPRAEAAPSSDDYILPDSSSRIYSREELEGLSDWELYIARNEIYARHGRSFKSADLQSYFNTKSWYTPMYSANEFDASVKLSDVENANAEAIRSIERERGSAYL